MTKIRIGDGRTPSGRILDRDTTWFTIYEKENAIKKAIETKKSIYVSYGNSAYRKITLEQLQNL